MNEKRMNLHEVVTALMFALEESEGEVTELVDQLEGTMLDKVDACCAIIELYESQAAGYAARIAALRVREKRAESRAAWLVEHVTKAMQSAGMEKMRTPSGFNLKFRTNKSCNVVDEEVLPTEFMRHVPERWEPNKQEMLKQLRAGVVIPGAELREERKLVID